MLTLGILRGLPGSGKSTLAFSLVSSGLYGDYYEADMFFERAEGYKFDKTKLKEAHDWCFNKVFMSLAMGRNTIVSNTFTETWEYQRYIDKAKELGYNIQVMVVASTFESVHDVPINTIYSMSRKLARDLMVNPLDKGLFS